MHAARLWAPITRVNRVEQIVEGCVAEQVTDKTGKWKFDYARSKPLFEAWIADTIARTGGKSQGNVREMHQPVAVGKALAWEFDDVARTIRVSAKIVDADAWLKVDEGVLNGFSIGGDYAGKWADPDEPGVTLFACAPIEVSIVDNPQMWGTTFEVIKAAGVVERRTFGPAGGTGMLRQTIRGLVTEGANRLERARAAGKADDALVATALPGGVQRGMYTVGWLARIIEDLGCVTSEAKWEAEYEADNSQVPAALAAQVSQLGAILVAMAMEEATELAAKFSDLASGSVAQAAEAKDVGEANDAGASVEQLARGLALVAKTPELRRAMSAEKKLARSMQKIHDNAVECGAMCQSVARAAGITAGGPAEGDDMTKDEVQAIVDGSLKRFLGVADAPAAPAPDPAPATPAAEGGFLMRAITAAVTAAVAPVAAKVETLEQRITDPKVQRALTATGDPAPAQPGRDPQATSVTVAPAKGAEATGGAQTPEVLRGVDPQVVDHMARRFGAGPQLQRAMADLTANTGAVELHAMPELARSMDQAGERARLALAGRLLRAVIADGPTVQIDSKPREVAII